MLVRLLSLFALVLFVSAEAHAAKVYERMGVEPGAVGAPSEAPAMTADAEGPRERNLRP